MTSKMAMSVWWDFEGVVAKDAGLRDCALGPIARLTSPLRPGAGQQWVEGGSYGSGVMRQSDGHDFFWDSGTVVETTLWQRISVGPSGR